MFAKLFLFFTTLFSVFNVNNTSFNSSDIVKPSYQLNTDTGSNEFIVKVNLYDNDKTTKLQTGSFLLKSKYNTDSRIFRDNEVLPSVYSNFWWSIPSNNPVSSGTTNTNFANYMSYSYDNTIKTYTYNYSLSDISISGPMRIVNGITLKDMATCEMDALIYYAKGGLCFTSEKLTYYLNNNVFDAYSKGFEYNFWLGGAYNSLSSYNNPNYQINESGFTTAVLMVYPENYNIETTKYLINAFYSNNGENGFFNSLLTRSSTKSYELNYIPTISELSIQFTSQTSFDLSKYKLSNASFVDNVNHTATLYFYISPNNNKEVVDIWGLAFSMITLPFTFFSTAFNLTIFEGTPYAFNFSWFLISVLCLLVLITLIRLILMFRK